MLSKKGLPTSSGAVFRRQSLPQAKARNPYAVGMAAAERQTGDTPPLKKTTIRKAHEIAKAVNSSKFSTPDNRFTLRNSGARAPVTVTDNETGKVYRAEGLFAAKLWEGVSQHLALGADGQASSFVEESLPSMQMISQAVSQTFRPVYYGAESDHDSSFAFDVAEALFTYLSHY